MHIISLTSLIEEAAFSEEGVRRDRGNVASLEMLLRPATLRSLEACYRVFAFVSFDPAGDSAIVEYLASNTLADDSGPEILTLVISPRIALVPRRMRAEELGGIEIERAELDAARFLAYVFDEKTTPPLPGVMLFRSFADSSEAVYFDMSGLSADEVRARLRLVFSLANDAIRASDSNPDDFAGVLSVEAQKARLEFTRSGPMSTHQWLVKVYQFLGDHLGDLVGIVNLAKGFVP
jgi:hypothetical protein